MRFQKRITIAKGLSLNISPSGLSFTAGVKGASINVGSKGVFLNTGIPGTGLSDRRQILGGTGSTARSKRIKSNDIDMNISLDMDDTGKIFIYDEKGHEITDENLVRKIKKTDIFKELSEELCKKKKEEIEGENEKFIKIFKYTPGMMTEDFLPLAEEYEIKPYPVPEPTPEECRAMLEEKAKKEVSSLLFWTNDEKRHEYVESHMATEYQKLLEKWQKDRDDFEVREQEVKRAEDLKRKEEYEKIQKELQEKSASPEDYINKSIEHLLKSIALPLEFSIDYEYDGTEGYLLVDLDLPEIEDMPQKKIAVLSGGKISIKDKTKKELNEDYVTCVCGLAFFFGGTLFNISTDIKKILISAYTQRVNTKTGNQDNEYVYSVVFDRNIFAGLNVENIEPLKGFDNFEHVINVTSSGEMKKIEPYTLMDKRNRQ